MQLTRLLATMFVLLSTGGAQAVERPNILIIVADDLGWHDVPWHGTDYAMPNLDKLAQQSLRLEAHYVHPMCSPTRAALLSGRYASRFGCVSTERAGLPVRYNHTGDGAAQRRLCDGADRQVASGLVARVGTE